MAERIQLPSCLLSAYETIFPTLDFSRIEFWLDPDMPVEDPLDPHGVTSYRLFRTTITIPPAHYLPCATGTFQLIAHELVHALQRQTQGVFRHRLASTMCWLLHGRDMQAAYSGNCVEKEAYDFGRQCEMIPSGSGPCQCRNAPHSLLVGNPEPNPSYPTTLALLPTPLVKREAGCSPYHCFGSRLVGSTLGSLVIAATSVILTAGLFYNEGTMAAAGTILGAIAGAAGALAASIVVGSALATGVIGIIVGTFVGAFLGGFVGALASWIAGLFGGSPRGGSLNLVFSTDRGVTFDRKVTFERSRQQPTLALRGAPDQLFLGWTGTDDQVNVFVAPDKSKTVLERSQPCGPALAFGDGKLFLAWKGEDGHPNCKWSIDGRGFTGHFWSGGDGPRESNVSAAYGRGMVYLAWVGSDNFIRLIQLRPTDPLTEVPNPVHMLSVRTGHQCTPALTFGDGRLFLAWSNLEPRHFLHVMRVPVDPSGHLVPFDQGGHTVRLNDWTTDLTGPALAYSQADRRLYLAFTGEDNRLYVATSADGGLAFSTRRIGEEISRNDAGPAIAAHPDGTVCLSWVGTDGA
jgi:hypothetical protein